MESCHVNWLVGFLVTEEKNVCEIAKEKEVEDEEYKGLDKLKSIIH